MHWRTSALIALAGTLIVWIAFSWPLPRHFAEAIPSSSQNIERDGVRTMIPGDHLQLLYHFWLAGDMAAGRTPLFNNVYEFNTGDDAQRRRVHPQFAPISLVYAALAALAGRAAAWNLTGILSLWLTWLFTWRLARRHAGEAEAALFSLVAILLPFRWVNLLGGSPAGFAMVWVPMVFLGLDAAIRDARPSGGVLAGLAILFASWTDNHIYLFTALAAPGWAILAMIRRPWPGRNRAEWLRLAGALAPAVALALATLAMSWLKARYLAGTGMGGGRTQDEVALFSPHLRDFFRWGARGIPSHVYVGFVMPALLAMGGIALLLRLRAGRDARRSLVVFALLLAAIGAVMLLATGVHGPWESLAWRAAVKLVPPYRMVRAPAKVFCLLPTFFAVAGTVGATAWLALDRRPRLARAGAIAAIALAIGAEMKAQVRATVCRLDDAQGAWRAVADDAIAARRIPRVLVVPLWPGDSDLCSAYQHYASLYRIRMANGYNPAVRADYRTTFYDRFRSVNQGDLDAAQLDDLLARGIDHLILHEDLFPEKVSPFPAGATLDRLSRNDRLEFLARDGRAWAFRILDAASAAASAPRKPALPPAPAWKPPARFVEGGSREAGETSTPCSGGGFARVKPHATFGPLPRVQYRPDPAAHWRVRCRGPARWLVRWTDEEGSVRREDRRENIGSAWTWEDLAPADAAWAAVARPTIAVEAGTLDVDVAWFASGDWQPPWPGHPVDLPPAWLFRAGHTESDRIAVRLDRDRDPDDRILYGPRLPLPPGRYRLQIEHDSRAPKGRLLGTVEVESPTADAPDEVPVRAGETPLVLDFRQPADIPFEFALRYARAADLTVRSVRLSRLE